MVGTGSASFCGEGGPGNATCLNNQRAVVMSSWGDLFFADSANKQVRKVILLSFLFMFRLQFVDARCLQMISSGLVRTVAGGGQGVYAGDGGPGTSASLSKHSALTIASWVDIFIAGSTNNVVRKVSTCLDVSCLYF